MRRLSTKNSSAHGAISAEARKKALNLEVKRILKTCSTILVVGGLLVAITVSFTLYLSTLSSTNGTAKLINMAGRQRALSERLTKLVFITGDSDHKLTNATKTAHQATMVKTLGLFQRSHLTVTIGNREGIGSMPSTHNIPTLISQLEPKFQNLSGLCEEWLQNLNVSNVSLSTLVKDRIAAQLLELQPQYFGIMHKLVGAFAEYSNDVSAGLISSAGTIVAIVYGLFTLVGLWMSRNAFVRNMHNRESAIKRYLTTCAKDEKMKTALPLRKILQTPKLCIALQDYLRSFTSDGNSMVTFAVNHPAVFSTHSKNMTDKDLADFYKAFINRQSLEEQPVMRDSERDIIQSFVLNSERNILFQKAVPEHVQSAVARVVDRECARLEEKCVDFWSSDFFQASYVMWKCKLEV